MNNKQNRRIEVAYSQEEMLRILESMRGDAVNSQDIYILAKDSTQFEDVKWDTDVIPRAAGNLFDQFKSWFTGDSAVMEGLKRFNLTDGQIAYYGHLLEHGAIVLVAEKESNVVVPEPFIDTIDHAENSSRID